MKNKYAEFALLFKALSDETRLKIIDMLSCGELCACDILKHLNITQPTLSYHMKMLAECGIVHADRQGAWMHYTLDEATAKSISEFWQLLSGSKENCICHSCCEQQENGCKSEDAQC